MSPWEVKKLLSWFDAHALSYPWGDNPTAYRVWISEIMLQQTVVTAAVGHFTRWMEQFPDIDCLAAADEQVVLKAWEGLGYYSRARNILKGAVYLKNHHASRVPDNYDQLIQVPGIGDYTARAILSLAFFKTYPVLDANVRRIGQRLKGQIEWGSLDDKLLLEDLGNAIPQESPGKFNCSLMQLGQLVCRVKSPHCGLCPLSDLCEARKKGLQALVPAPKQRTLKEKKSALFVFHSQRGILLTRRSKGIGEGLWFFPSCPEGLEEETLQSLQSYIIDKAAMKKRVHLYTSWRETLMPQKFEMDFSFQILPSFLKSDADDEEAWFQEHEWEDCPMPSVYRKIVKELSIP